MATNMWFAGTEFGVSDKRQLLVQDGKILFGGTCPCDCTAQQAVCTCNEACDEGSFPAWTVANWHAHLTVPAGASPTGDEEIFTTDNVDTGTYPTRYMWTDDTVSSLGYEFKVSLYCQSGLWWMAGWWALVERPSNTTVAYYDFFSPAVFMQICLKGSVVTSCPRIFNAWNIWPGSPYPLSLNFTIEFGDGV